MAKLKIAIYDLDQAYRDRFADYLVSHKAEEMEVSIFSRAEYLRDALEVDNYQLAVIGRGYEAVLKELAGKKIPVLVLMENVPECTAYQKPAEFAAEEIVYQKEAAIAFVFKYQSADEIIRQMYLLTDYGKRKARMQKSISDVEIIGVFSPVRHEMQMMFSLLYAENISKDRRTLYLNFMEYSGFFGLFGKSGGCDLGDLILRLRDGKLNSAEFLDCVNEMGGFSYIPPFENPENLPEVGIEDYKRLIAYILKNTDFEVIVIDFGPQMKDFTEMLDLCTLIYCIGKTGYYFECQIEQFMDYLRKTMEEAFFERLRRLDLPFQAKWIRGGGNLLEQLSWSEFGDFVRECMEGGSHENPG